MKCPKCGAESVEGARFCGECGTPVEPTPAKVPSVTASAQAKSIDREAFMRTVQATAPSAEIIAAARAAAEAKVAEARAAEAKAAEAKAAEAARAAAPKPSPSVRAAAPSAMPAGGASAAVASSPGRELVGTTLNGRYRVIARIGEGGFGAVYKGEQIAMGRECAIKVLHGRMARDPQVVGRFRREAQAASVLRAAHTVGIYDFDQTPEGILYLAMELLHGRSLHEEMQAGPMSPTRVAHVLDGICDSLGEAHAQGIVHRDIKPENIFLETRGADSDFVKVLDFGIAKIMSGSEDKSAPQLTAAGQTLGTVEYMSPEQLMGQPLDGRSDLYALGFLGYEMLCGHLPFPNQRTPGEMITSHLRMVPPLPSVAHPELGIPPLLDEILMKLVEKQRDKRYKDAAELQTALRRVPEALTAFAAARAAAPPPSRVIGLEEVDDAPTRPDLRPVAPLTHERRSIVRGSQSNTLYLIAGVVFLIAALAAAYFLFGKSASAAELPPPALAPAPARLLPAGCQALFSIDVKQLRAASPPAAVDQMDAMLRSELATLGAAPERIGRLAIGVESQKARPATTGAMKGLPAASEDSAIVIAEMPVDKKKLDAAVGKQLKKGQRFAPASYKGVAYRKGPPGEYAILPGDRILLASGTSLSRALDVQAGQATALVDGEARTLLDLVGQSATATPGEGKTDPAAYGWAKLDEGTRAQMDRWFPGTRGVEQMAGSLAIAPAGGADATAVGHCGTAEGCKAAADATRAAIARGKTDPKVALLGLNPLVQRITVKNDGPSITLALHLDQSQWTDVVSRLSGMVAATAQALLASGPDPEPAPVNTPAPVPVQKKRAKP